MPARIAAFFDLDGTLLTPPSLERRFLRYLRWRGELTAAHGIRWLGKFLRHACRDWLAATEGNKAHLAGLRAEILDAFLETFGRRPLEFFPEALQRLEWHTAQAHRIFLVTGTLKPLACDAARRLPVSVTICATELESLDGRWTGRSYSGVPGTTHDPALCGPAKARVLERLAREHQLDLARSYAYGNAWADRWMLERVGRPAAVNPSLRLARLARHRGWPVLRWNRGASQSHEDAEETAPAMDSWQRFGTIWRSP